MFNHQLEMVQVRRMMEEDLDIVFETDFNSKGRAVVWRLHPDIKTMSQAVIHSDGSLLYHSDSVLDEAMRLQHLEDESQITFSERELLKAQLKVDEVGLMSSSFLPVKKGAKYTYVNAQGLPITAKWFEWVQPFQCGLAAVEISKNSWNYIRPSGELLLDSTVQMAYDFVNGIGIVKQKGQFHLIDEMGHRLSDYYDDISPFIEGYSRVFRKGKYNFLNVDLDLIFDRWLYPYRLVDDFSQGRAMTIRHRGAINYVKPDGNYLFVDHLGNKNDLSLYSAAAFEGGFAKITDYSARGGGSLKYNFVDPSGKFLCRKWFPYAGNFNGGLALVSTGRYYNYINYQGELLLPHGYLEALGFHSGLAPVKLSSGSWTYINKRGEELDCRPMKSVHSFSNGRALIEQEDGFHLIDMRGEIVTKKPYSEFLDDPSIPLFYRSPYVRLATDGPSKKVERINWFGEAV